MAINLLEDPRAYPQYADIVERATGGEVPARMPNYGPAPDYMGSVEASRVPAGTIPIAQDEWTRGAGPVDLRGQGMYLHASKPFKPQPLPYWMSMNPTRPVRRMAPIFNPNEVRDIFRSGNVPMMNAVAAARNYEADLNARNAMAAGMPPGQVLAQYADQKQRNAMMLESYKQAMRQQQAMTPPAFIEGPGGARFFQTGRGWDQVYQRQAPAPPKSPYTPNFKLSQLKTLLDETNNELKKYSAIGPMRDPAKAQALSAQRQEILKAIQGIGQGAQGIPRVTTQEQFDALDPGQLYIGPNGVPATKPSK